MSIYKNETTHEEMKQEAVLRMQILRMEEGISEIAVENRDGGLARIGG